MNNGKEHLAWNERMAASPTAPGAAAPATSTTADSADGETPVYLLASAHSLRNKLGRVVWGVVRALLYRPSPRPFHAWRRLLLRVFGAKIGRGARPYSTAVVWAPWNLEMGDNSCLGDYVDCYSV